MKKYLLNLFIPLLILTGILLSSCGNATPPAQTETQKETDPTPAGTESETEEIYEGPVLDLNQKSEDGSSLLFRVVRNDYSDNKAADVAAAVKIRNWLQKATGLKVNLVTDAVDKDKSANEKIYEICVGVTNREHETQYDLLEDDFILIAEEYKIFILAASDGAYDMAATTFLQDWLGLDLSGKESQTLDTIRADSTEQGHWLDPEKVLDDGNEKVLFGLSQNQADEFFGEILDGLFTGKTSEVVDRKTKMGDSFKMHFPDMVYVNGQYMAYYICYKTKNGKGGVGLATSEDGVNFTDHGCVIQPDQDYDRNGAYFAGVWFDTEDDTFYIVYECKGDGETSYGTLENVALATSDDGINWTKEGIIVKRDTQTWTSANVGTPDLYKADGVWYVYFHGFDYKTCQVGVAYGEDLFHLKMVDKPILPTEPNTLWAGTTGRRDIIYVDGYYYMVYEISTEQAPDGGYNSSYWTHMFARSDDLIHWESVSAPLIRQTTDNGEFKNGFGYDGPCWCIIGKHIYVYFRWSGNCTWRAELVLNVPE